MMTGILPGGENAHALQHLNPNQQAMYQQQQMSKSYLLPLLLFCWHILAMNITQLLFTLYSINAPNANNHSS
jgi:hypothetical protein